MSYTALYRKWRPKTLDEVKGQDAICRTLKNQVVSQRVGHAYFVAQGEREKRVWQRLWRRP